MSGKRVIFKGYFKIPTGIKYALYTGNISRLAKEETHVTH